MKRTEGTSLLILAAVMILNVLLVSCGDGEDNDTASGAVSTVQTVPCPASGTIDVSIVDVSFNPSTVIASSGAVVKWTNDDISVHTVTSTAVPDNGSFDSAGIGPGNSICFRFTAAGVFNYFCSIHPQMTGTVTIFQ